MILQEPIEKKDTSISKLLRKPNEIAEDIINTLPVHPTKIPQTQTTVEKLIVHTTDGVVTPRGLAKYDIGPNHISSTGCPTVTYHYFLESSGKAYKICNHETVVWHAGNHNKKTLAIVLNYKQDHEWEALAVKGEAITGPDEKHRPSEAALNTLVELLASLCIEYNLTEMDVFGHRELSGTGHTYNIEGKIEYRKTCPGMYVNLDMLRSRIRERLLDATGN